MLVLSKDPRTCGPMTLAGALESAQHPMLTTSSRGCLTMFHPSMLMMLIPALTLRVTATSPCQGRRMVTHQDLFLAPHPIYQADSALPASNLPSRSIHPLTILTSSTTENNSEFNPIFSSLKIIAVFLFLSYIKAGV